MGWPVNKSDLQISNLPLANIGVFYQLLLLKFLAWYFELGNKKGTLQ